ncbi:MAG: hypothetical protein ACLR23_22165 [Clostridia bacterium]
MQQEWFIEQIELAKELELPSSFTPVMPRDTFQIIKRIPCRFCSGGVIHSYHGRRNWHWVSTRLLGFYIGIQQAWHGGVPKCKKVIQTVREIRAGTD